MANKDTGIILTSRMMKNIMPATITVSSLSSA